MGVSNFLREKPWRPPSLLLEADPPRHDAPRVILEKLLSQRRLRDLGAQWQTDAAVLVDEVLSRGAEFDAVTDLAEVFPLRVFPDAVGLGKEGREHLLPYGDYAFNAFGPRNERVTGPAQAIAPADGVDRQQCRRENLAPGGFGAQIWDAADKGDITPEQAPLIVRSLLTAGVDTTVTGIAAVMHAIATHPEEYQRLRGDRSLLSRAFEEAVRLESPVQTFFRTTTTEISHRRGAHSARSARCSCSSVRPTATLAGGRIRTATTSPAIRPDMSDSAWAPPVRRSARRPPRGGSRSSAPCSTASRRIELTATPTRHLNNTLRGLGEHARARAPSGMRTSKRSIAGISDIPFADARRFCHWETPRRPRGRGAAGRGAASRRPRRRGRS